MNPTRPRVAPASFAVALALALAWLGPTSSATAQGFGPDPFRPYNSQYDPYVFGVAPGPLDSVGNPSQNRQGVRNANQFRDAVEGLDNSNRYDRSFRAYDQDRKRIYRPNAEADKKYNSRRDKASDIYFQYLREQDPRKRAQLFKEYNQAQADVARGLAADPNARGTRRAGGVPPVPEGRGGAERMREGAVPATPDGYGSRSATSVRPRRATRPSTRASSIPPAPAGDERSPSDVLDRASRSGRTAPPSPPEAP